MSTTAAAGVTTRNDDLRQARERTPSPFSPGTPLSRQELAEAVNGWVHENSHRRVEIDANYIGKLERGIIRWPGADYRAALRSILSVSSDPELGFHRPRRRGFQAGDDVNRKEFLGAALGFGASTLVSQMDSIRDTAASIDLPRNVSTVDIDDVWSSVDFIEAWDNSRGGGMARAAISGQLRYAIELLNCRHSESIRYDLFSSVGSLAYKSGFASFDAFNHTEATSRYVLALNCAQAVNNWHLRAMVFAGMARQAFWRGETQEALTNVEMALVRSDLLTSTERSMLSSLRARALARLGRRQETLRALGIADEEFASSHPEGDPQFIRYYDAAEHRGETGHALADIATTRTDATEAMDRLTTASDLHGDSFARSRAFCQLRLARLLLTEKEVGAATRIGSQALSNISRLRSDRLAIVVNELEADAAPYRHLPEVVDLHDRIAGMR